MKRIIIIAAILTSICVSFLYFNNNKTIQKEFRIAIFTPATHPALEEIEQGFKETLEQLHPSLYAYTIFNANGNRTLLRGQAEEIVMVDYDVVFTIGAHCSQTVAQLIAKRGKTTAHIFGAVDSLEFAQALMRENSSSTGVYVALDYQQAMDAFYTAKPSIKNLLLVYDPTHGTGLEKYKTIIENHIKKYGIRLRSVEVYQTNEIQQKVEGLLPSVDAVLVLVDNTVVAGIDSLIALCNRYGVTLMASDLASGTKGAVLAYGITEYASGSNAANVAYSLLIEGKKPSQIPLHAVTDFKLAVNQETMKLQNLTLKELQ
jgi:putative tryptophan/tyrosine transport system substrate-binding protein